MRSPIALFAWGETAEEEPAEVVTAEDGEPAGRPEGMVVREDDPRPLVILDPGHGGSDPGTHRGPVFERALNFDTARRVARMLEEGGARVLFTREEDEGPTVGERAAFANRYPWALFVSIHHNGFTTEVPRGVETYFSDPKASATVAAQRKRFGLSSRERFVDQRSEALAASVQESVCAATGAVDRGLKNGSRVARLGLVRLVSCPAVLVECGFISNPAERLKLQDPNYREKVSRGIADGVLGYLNSVESDPLFGVTLPDRATSSELADIRRAEAGQ